MPFIITPNSGYQISNVIVDGVSKGPITFYEFDNIQSSHQISASFAPTPTPTAVALTPEALYGIAAVAIGATTTTTAVIIKKQRK